MTKIFLLILTYVLSILYLNLWHVIAVLDLLMYAKNVYRATFPITDMKHDLKLLESYLHVQHARLEQNSRLIE